MKRFKLLAAIFILLLILAPVANAGVTAAVTATVTAQSISVGVDDSDIEFGVVTTSSTEDTTTSGIDTSITATNDGNIVEDFNIMSGDSTNWTLAASASSETFTMKSCVSDCDGTPTWNAVGIDPSYVQLANDVATSGTQVFDLQVGTPTSTTSYTQQTITVTIQAVTGSQDCKSLQEMIKFRG